MTLLWPGSVPVVVRAGELVLREWRPDDAEVMVGLFDTDEMDRRTPLASPFDQAAALRYVAAAHRARQNGGSLQLAITVAGGVPLGEVLAFPIGDGAVELAYAVGAAHRGRGLAGRAVAAVLDLVRAAGVRRVELRIADDNLASQRVAAASGFALTNEPAVVRRRKGQVLRLATWRLTLASGPVEQREIVSGRAVEVSAGELALADGRVLGWRVVGAPEHPPILWLHGSTGSKQTAPVAPGLRMIAYDRPGYGASSVHRGRTLTSDAEDVGVLLDALAVPAAAVLAFSGGAAVGYACAALLRGRVTRLGIVSGATWPSRPVPAEQVLTAAAAALQADPAAAVAGLLKDAPAVDARVLSDPAVQQVLLQGAQDAIAAGVEGWITEARVTRAPWPFQPQDIPCPVLLWHGLADDALPLAEVLPAAARLPRAQLHRLPDSGHLGWLAHQTEVLKALTTATSDDR